MNSSTKSRPNSAGAGPHADSTEPNGRTTATEQGEFERFRAQCGEFAAFFLHYVAAKADSAKLALRSVVLVVAGAVVAFVVLTSVSVMAIWFLMCGAAEGLSLLLGGRPWAGSLAAGLLFLGGAWIGLLSVFAYLKNLDRAATMRKYQRRQSRRKERYGSTEGDPVSTNGVGQH